MKMTVEVVTIAYKNVKNPSLCHRKQVCKVTREDGKSITFVEKMSKRQALKQATLAGEVAWK
jgi:hypothetical protein